MHTRKAGWLILAGMVSAIAWRVLVAPAVLGDFDSSDMPHRERAFLALGNILTAGCLAGAHWSMARAGMGRSPQLARLAAPLTLVAGACAGLGALVLVWSEAGNALVVCYAIGICASWMASGVSLFRLRRDWLGALGLTTGVVYLLALAAIAFGAHILFLMTVAAAPLALAMLIAGDGGRMHLAHHPANKLGEA